MTATQHPVVTEAEWIAARQELLAEEKALTRQLDHLAEKRRQLPWVRVEKEYTFEGPRGPLNLADLFDGKSQLVVYHFMFAPGWGEGCQGCSFLCDHIDGANQHLKHHDVAVVAVSRAPYAELRPYKERMGWEFAWVSSGNSDFNYDFGASFRREDLDSGPVFFNFKPQTLNGEEQPGLTVFFREEDGTIYRTYSTYERGGDILIGAHNWLDLTPKGRNESEVMDWMKRHDEYAVRPAGELPEPKFVDAPAITLAGLARTYTYESMHEIPGLWHEFGPQIDSVPNMVGNAAYGAVFSFGTNAFRYLAGVEVDAVAGLPQHYFASAIPPSDTPFSGTTATSRLFARRSTRSGIPGSRTPG